METYSKSEKEQKPVTLDDCKTKAKAMATKDFPFITYEEDGAGGSMSYLRGDIAEDMAELYAQSIASSLRQENQQLRELVDAQNAYIKFLLDYEKALAPHLSASGIVPSRSIVTEGSQLREKILVAEQALQNTKGK